MSFFKLHEIVSILSTCLQVTIKHKLGEYNVES
jgi:hypothetical protein